MDLADMFMFRLLHKISGIAQSHITEAELEIVVTPCLDIITQVAAAGSADNVHMEHLIPHVNPLIHTHLPQHAHHININAKVMT
jgi:DNA-binding FrmR family transcriptional regulator